MFGGHGVLILPDVVLTSWHVLEGGLDVTFINEGGDRAEIVRKSFYNKKDIPLDIATVELSKPLTNMGALFASDGGDFYGGGGWLAHRFSGSSEAYSVKFSSKYYKADMKNRESGIRTFESDQRVFRGYSGSPVFNKKGELASLLTFGRHKSLKDMESGNGSKIFGGPSPHRLAAFIRKAIF